jgi:hypothetical protein
MLAGTNKLSPVLKVMQCESITISPLPLNTTQQFVLLMRRLKLFNFRGVKITDSVPVLNASMSHMPCGHFLWRAKAALQDTRLKKFS